MLGPVGVGSEGEREGEPESLVHGRYCVLEANPVEEKEEGRLQCRTLQQPPSVARISPCWRSPPTVTSHGQLPCCNWPLSDARSGLTWCGGATLDIKGRLRAVSLFSFCFSALNPPYFIHTKHRYSLRPLHID